ncbi:MAG: hypothetical protein AABO57_27200 [Acidobacteriota bacterium]
MPPGQEGKIELAVEHTEGFSGEVAKSASVSTNDPKTPNFNLVLRARFKTNQPPATPPPPPPLNPNPVLRVEPGDRWTTSVLSGSSSSNTMFLYNPLATPVHAKRIIPGGNEFTATLQTIQDGKRYEILVASNPALKPGHYLQTLKVLTDSTTQPEVAIELELTVYPKVFASPPSITMPTMPAAADLSAINWPMIYVRKIREKGLIIKGYSSTLPFIKLELLTETEGQVYKIRLTLDTTKIKPGEFKGTVHIETNDPEVPVLDVPVQGSFK